MATRYCLIFKLNFEQINTSNFFERLGRMQFAVFFHEINCAITWPGHVYKNLPQYSGDIRKSSEDFELSSECLKLLFPAIFATFRVISDDL